MNRWTFTSESVTEGHPDKMADQISDAVLDALLQQDPLSRVACETLLTTGLVMVAGEITTKGYVEIPKLVREVVTDIGYTSSEMGFDGRTCGVSISIGAQSPDIAQGVDTALEVRAGTRGAITWSRRSGSSKVSRSMLGLCWVEIRTVRRRTGRPSAYSKVTWVLPSGRRYGSTPTLRTWARRWAKRCASQIGIGIRSAVSSQA